MYWRCFTIRAGSEEERQEQDGERGKRGKKSGKRVNLHRICSYLDAWITNETRMTRAPLWINLCADEKLL